MIPSLGWWPEERAYAGRRLEIGFLNNDTSLWPSSLSAIDIMNADFRTSNNAYVLTPRVSKWCPMGGYEQLLGWARTFADLGNRPSTLMLD